MALRTIPMTSVWNVHRALTVKPLSPALQAEIEGNLERVNHADETLARRARQSLADTCHRLTGRFVSQVAAG